MTPRDILSPHPGRKRALLVAGFATLLALLFAAAPAAANLTSITTAPPSPTTCDPVVLVVAGTTPDPCYTIVRADLHGPVELPTMGPIPAYGIDVRLVLRRTIDPDSNACPTVIQPYQRAFELGRLRWGSYWVNAYEYVTEDGSSTGHLADSLSASFDVRMAEECPQPTSCFLLDFGRRALPYVREGTCNAAGAPGGTACTEILLTNESPVAGVQTDLLVHAPGTRDPVPGESIHAISVQAVGRAAGLQVQWVPEGSTTRIVLYSTGEPIPAGRDAILRICYALAPDVTPDVYPLRFGETIVADPRSGDIPPCPTFAEVGGRLCVTGPGCDLNGDGQGNILDVVQLVNCVLYGGSTEACPDSVAARADCNEDGSIDVRDVICCVRKILGSGGFGHADPGGGTGDPTRIGFTGPVQWTTPLTGRAEIKIEPGFSFAGIDFSIDAASSGARIAGLRLLPGSGLQLESQVAPDGSSARAMLLEMGAVSMGAEADGATRSGDVLITATIIVELVPSLPMGDGGALSLAGAQSANRDAGAMPTMVGPVTAPVPSLATPAAPSVSAARPNPFRDETEIAYALPSAARATLRVYSASGRLVRTLVDSEMPAGVHRARWDGKDSTGRPVSSGIYFFRFSAGEVARTQRMMLLR